MCGPGTEALRQRRGATTSSTERAVGRNKGSKTRIEKPVVRDPVWSSTVPFYPPSNKYWRIGNQWYDFSTFNHPGGRQILEITRDRFEDATFAFEAHHHNYQRARQIIQKYRVPDEVIAKEQKFFSSRPSREESSDPRFAGPRPTHHDVWLDANKHPHLSDDDAFYSVLRRRVASYLVEVGCKDGDPTWQCVILFWAVFFAWLTCMTVTYYTGSFLAAFVTGLVGAVLCSFGHNWTHQPKYKRWGWGILSMDVNGYSSEGWFREHVLQHHMFTNTPWDHNVHAMEPFILADPTIPRNFIQKNISPYLVHIFFCFGSYFNYLFHTIWLLQGWEEWSVGKPIFFLEHVIFWNKWGWQGLLLMFTVHAVVANYFFTLSFMNHNADQAKDISARNAAKDWAEAQLLSCVDWSVHLSFVPAFIFLGLNFHTCHHSKFLYAITIYV